MKHLLQRLNGEDGRALSL